MTKTSMILELAKQGKGAYEIAREVYEDTSRRTLNKVWVILNRLEKRGLLSRNRSKERMLNNHLRRLKDLMDILSGKKPLKAEREKFSSVPSWNEMAVEVREIASEAYELAREAIKQGNLRLAKNFLELVLRCMAEIRYVRKELDLETLSQAVEQIRGTLKDERTEDE